MRVRKISQRGWGILAFLCSASACGSTPNPAPLPLERVALDYAADVVSAAPACPCGAVPRAQVQHTRWSSAAGAKTPTKSTPGTTVGMTACPQSPAARRCATPWRHSASPTSSTSLGNILEAAPSLRRPSPTQARVRMLPVSQHTSYYYWDRVAIPATPVLWVVNILQYARRRVALIWHGPSVPCRGRAGRLAL